MYRYFLRQTVVGDGRRLARTPLREAQERAGVPAGRWMGRGLAVLGLAPGEEVTEAQLRSLFGERGRHPYADRIEAELLAKGASPKEAFKAGALGRRVTVTGVDFVFRPQPTIYLLWALGDEETRRVIEAAHERAIVRVLEWVEDEVAVIRYGKDGVYRVRPPGGLVAARFRHYEACSGMPLLHDHLLLSVKGQRLDGKWGSIHTLALHENTVAASALYNELVAAEGCEALGLATEPRTVTPGRRPVMEIAGVPYELIRWTARRSDQIAACLAELEHEYVTAAAAAAVTAAVTAAAVTAAVTAAAVTAAAVAAAAVADDGDGDGEPKFLSVVSERARAKLNRSAGAPPAGARTASRQGGRPLSAPDAVVRTDHARLKARKP